MSLGKKPLVRYAALLARLGLGASFLSAVADRFGLWGAPGAPGVAWGNFDNFLASTARLNPFVPASLIPALGGFVTLLEVVLGVALVAGLRLRDTALASGALLLVFALAMSLTGGLKGPLDYSVFSAAAAAFLLAAVSDAQSRPDSER